MSKKVSKKPISKTTVRTTAATSSVQNSPYFDYAILGGLFLLMFILRLPFLDIALERDESAYAYIGQRALGGLIPYRDFYEMKPPLLFYAYALLTGIFGYSAKGLHVALLAINLLNAGLIYGISRRFFDKGAGLIATVAYILLAFNPMASGLWLVSEHILMAFVLAGIYSFQKGLTQHRWLLAAGIFLSCAILVKQIAGVFGLWAGIMLLIRYIDNPAQGWKTLIRQMGWLAAGAAIPILIALGVVTALGAWQEFSFWMFEYPAKYMDGVKNTSEVDVFGFQWKRVTGTYIPYWIVGIAGAAALFFTEKTWMKKVGIVLLIALSFATILPGKRYYGHYWQQFFPALAIGIGAAAYAVRCWWKGIASSIVTGVFLLFSLYHLLIYSQQYFQAEPDALTETAYAGNPFSIHKKMAAYLNSRIKPEDQLMVFGSEPQFYVYTNKKSPSRHFYTGFTSREIPEASRWQQETLADLKKARPEYLIFSTQRYSWMMKPKSDQTLYQEAYKYAMANYTPVAVADFIQPSGVKLYFDAEAAAYRPVSNEFILIMHLKQ